ncbi:MAG TPA: diaminopimelate epimerase [Bacteroidales bacterium]|nr:diaminopimelate epimerase [Bacteroidales bacterium]HQB21788.1 diaminopimelate epimerase [Bacteroidales bacterium]
MLLHFSKFQGAGNDFIIINMMDNQFELNQRQIEFLCNRRFGIGADGLMLVQKNDDYDFYMQYFNSDGKEGSMCGNGGRCIAKYAYLNKISSSEVKFLAIDGKHKATINRNSVSLSMSNVDKIQDFEDGYFLDTGSPHFVSFVKDLNSINVKQEGRKIADEPRFSPMRTNVNFVEIKNDNIRIATFERGVEDETLACGTGSVASALAIHHSGKTKSNEIVLIAKGGRLKVNFENKNNIYQNIILSGDAEFVFEGRIDI